jgi:glycosyltransferase involved in cell wall biosynthesis/GT2 family glycosyltransferase
MLGIFFSVDRKNARWRQVISRYLACALINMRSLARQWLPRWLLGFVRQFVTWASCFIIGIMLVPYVRSRQFDMVHAVLPGSYVVGSLATLTTSASNIMSRVSLNWYQREDWLFYLIERYFLHHRLDAAVCNCAKIASELEQEGIKPDKIHLIHNGIDTADFARRLVDPDKARRMLGLPKDALVISNIANFHRYKGHVDLLQAVASVRNALPDWRLILVGRDVGGNTEGLRRLCRRLDIADRVIFLGEQENVPLILSAADLHVSASHTEGLPNNIIEAMCAGLPVVATAVGGTPELVEHERTGLLVSREDPGRLASAILLLANAPQLRRSFGAAGRQRILQSFTIERTADLLLRLYRDIGARRRAGLQHRLHRHNWIAGRVRLFRPAYLRVRGALAAADAEIGFGFRSLGRAFEPYSINTTVARNARRADPPPTVAAPQILRELTVDVVIPVRNRALFIAECLDSVRAQTLQPRRVIVVDDGSTDATPEILKHYANNWDRLHLIQSPHRGVSAARNLGISSSTAELIALLDSDDLWHPEKLARQIELFSEKERAPGLVHCGIIEIDERGRLIGRELLPWMRGNLFDSMLNEFYHILGSCSAALIPRELLLQVGGFDENLQIGEDCDLFFRLARVAPVDYVPEALTYLRRHPKGTYRQSRRLNPHSALFQRLQIWNKYLAEIRHMDQVRAKFRAEAAEASITNLFRLNFAAGTYDCLQSGDIELARHLFTDRRDYLQEVTLSCLLSIFGLPTRILQLLERKRENKALDDAVIRPALSILPAAGHSSASESIQRHPRDPDSDVTALIFSVGEAIDSAVEHLNRQSVGIHEMIVVRNFAPFHRAMNAGAAQIKTAFFIQVDSDMRLDEHCVQSLRAAMEPDVGIAVGYLRDSLMKVVVGIKLFRTECFSHTEFRNSISPDTDFVDAIASAGWKTVYVGVRTGGEDPETLGDHCPDYTPAYTYRKYLMEGKRYRYRGAPKGLLWHLRELELSRHPSSLFAQIGLCRGIFQAVAGDELGLELGTDEVPMLSNFLEDTDAQTQMAATLTSEIDLPEVIRDQFLKGAAFFRTGDSRGFLDCMGQLSSQNGTMRALLAKIALCQGLLSQSDAQIAEDYLRLADFINDPAILPPPSLPIAQPDMSREREAANRTAGEALGRLARISKVLVRTQVEAKRSKSGVKAAFASMTRLRPARYTPKPNKLVMVTGNLGVGGSERQMVAVVSGLLARRYEVSILALEEVELGMPSFEDQLREMGVNIEIAPKSAGRRRLAESSKKLFPGTNAVPEWLIDNIATVCSHIERHRPAAVHCWLDHPSIYGGFAGCVLGVPRILLQFGSTSTIFRRNAEWAGFWQQAYQALAGNSAVKFLNNSHAGARDYEEWIGLKQGSVGVLYNGFIATSVRKPSPEETSRLRAFLALPVDVVVVGALMRFAPEKDPYLWLDTASEIARVRRDVRFVVFGYGPLEHEIKERISALGLQEVVKIGGATDDAGLAYSVMDIFLLTSAVEGVPNVVIEAQAAGLPVVVPDVGGASEGVLDGVTGIVARPRSSASLASAVLDLIDNPAWRRAVERDGPRFVADRFGLDRMVGETAEFYAI